MRHTHLARLALLFLLPSTAFSQTETNRFEREAVTEAEKLIGLDFSDAKIDMMLPGLRDQLRDYEALRKVPISNSVPPALLFNPIPMGMRIERGPKKFKLSASGKVTLPKNFDDLAFYSIGELSVLIRRRQITSEKLVRFYLDRLKRYGPKLECVVTLTEGPAL